MQKRRDSSSTVRNITDPAERYANRLQFLWDQYNKLMGLGILASTVTLGFLLQGVLFNKDAREVMVGLQTPLNTKFLMASIVLSGVSGVFFIICRWCSQILMERQVYGDLDSALRYFQHTLNGETIWPTALKPKIYMWWITRERLLKIVGGANELFKWLGIACIFCSWLAGIFFAWPLIEPLATVASTAVKK